MPMKSLVLIREGYENNKSTHTSTGSLRLGRDPPPQDEIKAHV
jgi:hypothetical protein